MRGVKELVPDSDLSLHAESREVFGNQFLELSCALPATILPIDYEQRDAILKGADVSALNVEGPCMLTEDFPCATCDLPTILFDHAITLLDKHGLLNAIQAMSPKQFQLILAQEDSKLRQELELAAQRYYAINGKIKIIYQA